MPYEVDRFCPQTWEIALNLEQWDKLSRKNRSTSGVSVSSVVNGGKVKETRRLSQKKNSSSLLLHVNLQIRLVASG
jgi:hypothetical protein